MVRVSRQGRGHRGKDERGVAAPAIEFRHVDFSYDDNKVLDDLSFQVARGEIKIILSGSGGGKSTILKLILGLLIPDAGQIFIDGEEITGRDEAEMQQLRLLRFVKLDKEMDKLPSELSGGMRKRVSVARALIGNPRIVLFDEPTVALDPPTSGTICDLIIELRDLERVSSIVVTHEMDVVKYLTSEYVRVGEKGDIQFKDEGEKLCLTNTRILMLRDGREIFSGTSKELIESDDPYIHEFIRGTELLPEKDESQRKAAPAHSQERVSLPHRVSR